VTETVVFYDHGQTPASAAAAEQSTVGH